MLYEILHQNQRIINHFIDLLYLVWKADNLSNSVAVAAVLLGSQM